MRKFASGLVLSTTCILVSIQPANTHSGAMGVVKQRMDAMSSIGDNVKVIAMTVKGQLDFDRAQIVDAARTIAGHAGKIAELFPEGTDHKPSEALPAIWQDWDRFTALAAELEEKALELASVAQAADGPNALAAPFSDVAKNCSNCHQKFRASK